MKIKKPTMLFASPFPPIASGISEYSSILVKELALDFDITLYMDNFRITDRSLKGFRVFKNGVDKVNFTNYDYLVYNIGNQPDFHGFIYEAALAHPGFVILHDFSLYYLFIGYHQAHNDLYSAIFRNEGVDFLRGLIHYRRHEYIRDILHCGYLASKYTLNEEMLASGNRFIVHSDYAKNKIMASGYVKEDDILRIGMIHQIEKDTKNTSREKLFKKYRVPNNKSIIAAFGMIADTKLNRETARAVLNLTEEVNKEICYIMVGEGNGVDDLLKKDTIIKTGYTSIDDFNSFIECADIVVNLRNPTRGETSASIMRALEKGKPCITNNGGWFSELPDDCVYKIELKDIENEICKAIQDLLTNKEKAKVLSEKARQYASEIGSPTKIRSNITRFLLDCSAHDKDIDPQI